jgi:hypothetical protein
MRLIFEGIAMDSWLTSVDLEGSDALKEYVWMLFPLAFVSVVVLSAGIRHAFSLEPRNMPLFERLRLSWFPLCSWIVLFLWVLFFIFDTAAYAASDPQDEKRKILVWVFLATSCIMPFVLLSMDLRKRKR